MKQTYTVPVRLSDELIRKLIYISEAEGRTPNNQFTFMLRNNIQYFERTKGRIPPAALSGIDVDQYEAAKLDGANRWQTMLHVTLPNLKPTIIVMLVLSIGNLMTGGFDQIFNLSNPAVEEVSEILDMYIYRVTFGSVPDFGFSMAISLFRSLVNCMFLIVADRGSKKLGGSGLFG